jgi:hypothetical protein
MDDGTAGAAAGADALAAAAIDDGADGVAA